MFIILISILQLKERGPIFFFLGGGGLDEVLNVSLLGYLNHRDTSLYPAPR